MHNYWHYSTYLWAIRRNRFRSSLRFYDIHTARSSYSRAVDRELRMLVDDTSTCQILTCNTVPNMHHFV